MKARLIYQSTSLDEVDYADKLAWSRGDYISLSEALFEVDWEGLFEGITAAECYNMLCEIVWDLIPQFIPNQGARRESQWLAKPPRSLKNRRRASWQSWTGHCTDLNGPRPRDRTC